MEGNRPKTHGNSPKNGQKMKTIYIFTYFLHFIKAKTHKKHDFSRKILV